MFDPRLGMPAASNGTLVIIFSHSAAASTEGLEA